MQVLRILLMFVAMVSFMAPVCASTPSHEETAISSFPPPLESYGDAEFSSLWEILKNRVAKQPFNLWATVLFLCAIVHTFMTHRFRHIAHELEKRHEQSVRKVMESEGNQMVRQVSSLARFFHFMGEIEAVFGIWAIPLMILMTLFVGRSETHFYMDSKVNFTEAVFVVVIMAIASTRPILNLAENILRLFARLGKEKPVAWWFSILTVGPLLGSFITEPAAMTICASLLSQKFYSRNPGSKLKYGTLGLLFVNISVGGTLTHFAAPPVLMVVDAWKWDFVFMMTHFGWKAAVGSLVSVIGYYLLFRKELGRLADQPASVEEHKAELPIPLWVTIGHVIFMIYAVVSAHEPSYLILGMLFFLAFVEVTEDFQRNFQLRPPVLVGFFLAGLVIHGGLQQWWIAPVLGRLNEVTLMLGAATLTAFNDNAAITYLCTLVPTFTEGMKYAAVAGAVAGGGLTVIANAPNPAGQSILNDHFEDGISALGLVAGALVPTIIVLAAFLFFR